jgi:DNA-binding winged helix-turn-helix (wHTH) protein
VVVYSFESNQQIESDIIPCSGRNYPEDQYRILFKIIEAYPTQGQLAKAEEEKSISWPFILLGIIPLLMILYMLFKKKKTPKPSNENHIHVGIYKFNQKTGLLILNDEKIQLTNKESDLLNLLFQNKNETVERDAILHAVWGDEGDYVGRTLDVFISKLRKKLESDETIKISNVRGVGYKLVLE